MILPPQADFITPSGDITSVNLVQDKEDPSLWSFVQEKDQYYTRVLILVQQCDENGRVGDSEWRKLLIARSTQGSEADTYEEDNRPGQAWPIVVNNQAQLHSFHTNTDTDWVYFFGHAGHQYDMGANDMTACRFIKLSLTDPNGKIVTTEAGVPMQNSFCSLRWQCPQDGYYFLNAEPASEYPVEGIGYTLSVEYIKEYTQSALSVPIFGLSAFLGRVVDSKQKGVNGLYVNLMSSGKIVRKTWTGSLQNVIGNRLNISKLDGWYFIPSIEPGVYDLMLTEDDPNIILKRVLEINLSPKQIKRIEDIVLDFPENWMDVVSEFNLVYTQYQNKKGKDYPVWQDNDDDELANLEEFLAGTDPDKRDNPFNINRDLVVPSGWSMISIPVMPENAFVSELLPGAEVIYGYERGTGYKRVKETEELEAGRGYWILTKEEKNYTLTGQSVYSYTISFNKDGWEMIGGCTYGAWPKTDSCNIGVIYEFVMGAGYQRILGLDDLEPGKGYWILINDIAGQCELRVEAN